MPAPGVTALDRVEWVMVTGTGADVGAASRTGVPDAELSSMTRWLTSLATSFAIVVCFTRSSFTSFTSTAVSVA